MVILLFYVFLPRLQTRHAPKNVATQFFLKLVLSLTQCFISIIDSYQFIFYVRITSWINLNLYKHHILFRDLNMLLYSWARFTGVVRVCPCIASTLGSLWEALLEFVKSPEVNIRVSAISIVPVVYWRLMSVKVSPGARELADKLGVKLFIVDSS